MSRRLPHLEVLKEICDLTNFMVEQGLCDDQNWPKEVRGRRKKYLVQYPCEVPFSETLRSQRYDVLYHSQKASRAFNMRLLDGALVQMLYEFSDRSVVRYRLAYLPAPDLTPFQEDPELYLKDLLYSEIVEPGVVTVPLRFDYDGRQGVPRSMDHPMSHLTLGQYRNCRIAASAGLTPTLFMEFVLRSFYNTAMRSFSSEFPRGDLRFEKCITVEEESGVHVGVPCIASH